MMEPKDNNISGFSVPQPTTVASNHMSSAGSLGVLPAAAPTMAGDSDLIEKEWVEAAKRIIEQNKQDPYSQSRALTALREDYMRKRYGKDIKAAE